MGAEVNNLVKLQPEGKWDLDGAYVLVEQLSIMQLIDLEKAISDEIKKRCEGKK